MDLNRNESTPSVEKLSRILSQKPKDCISLKGEMDLSRPDSINQQSLNLEKAGKRLERPKDALKPLEGPMDISRPDSITHQTIQNIKPTRPLSKRLLAQEKQTPF